MTKTGVKTEEETLEQKAQKAVDDFERKAIKIKGKAELLQALVEAIFEFAQYITGIPLFSYQANFGRRMIQSVILNDGENITALFSRQSGKTTTVSVVVSGLAVLMPKLARIDSLTKVFPELKYFDKGIWIGIFAPVLDQAQTLFQRIRGNFSSKHAESVLKDPEINESVETNNGAVIRLSSGSLVECRSASPTANIESKTYHLIIIDEAQDVETNKLRKSISPMGAFTNATQVMSGTCNTVKSAFYEQVIQNKHALVAGRKANHFEYDYHTVQKFNPRYENYIQKEKDTYGEDSDEFRMSYKLEWIFERGMFTSEETLRDRAFNNKYNRGDFHKFRGWKIVAAIDFGKSQDSTVFTVGVVDWFRPVRTQGDVEYYRCAVLDWLEIAGDDWNSQYHQLMDKIREYPLIEKLVCDATGTGGSITDRFKSDLINVEVEDFVFSAQQKSDGYKNLSVYISQGLLWLPNGEATQKTREFKKCILELTSLEKEYRGQHMVCHAPQGVRNAHDDYPDSLMMFTWGIKTPPMSNFESFEETIYSNNTSGHALLNS